ncbi:MAG: TlpA family protein disulfide reductase [Bacteroidaceae bacterium]|nr:TlpA family protein disulfide reductase [Bacteroidaceae bacterium]
MKKLILTLIAALLSLGSYAQTNMPTLKEGDAAPAFSVPDTLGVRHSLSDYEGKYLVIDFWASWCGDCRREIPELKKVFSEFNEEIIGPEQVEVNFISISFDHKVEAWKEMLRKENFGWPQVSNLQPWKENEVAKAYDLHWIPTFFVVNPMGKIVGAAITAQGLRDILETLK